MFTKVTRSQSRVEMWWNGRFTSLMCSWQIFSSGMVPCRYGPKSLRNAAKNFISGPYFNKQTGPIQTQVDASIWFDLILITIWIKFHTVKVCQLYNSEYYYHFHTNNFVICQKHNNSSAHLCYSAYISHFKKTGSHICTYIIIYHLWKWNAASAL